MGPLTAFTPTPSGAVWSACGGSLVVWTQVCVRWFLLCVIVMHHSHSFTRGDGGGLHDEQDDRDVPLPAGVTCSAIQAVGDTVWCGLSNGSLQIFDSVVRLGPGGVLHGSPAPPSAHTPPLLVCGDGCGRARKHCAPYR